MTSTVYTDYTTPAINAAWLNDVDKVAYQRLSAVTGTNTITATGPATLSAYAGTAFEFIAPNANTGAVTLNISGIGAIAVTKNGASALVTGDILAGKACRVLFDGTQFQLLNPAVSSTVVPVTGIITPQQYGAIGNGVADDTASFTSADAFGSSVYVPKGTYKITSNIALSNQFVFLDGAILSVNTGVTVTFNGGISAPLSRIFTLTGTAAIVFDSSQQTVGFPEWWGAVANSSGTDCLAAINACIVACPITQLQLADYYISGTIVMSTAKRRLKGVNKSWTSSGGTRIISTSGSATGILMGLASNPGSINAQLQHVYVEDVVVTRNATIVSTGTVYGVLNQWTLFSGLYRCEFLEHKIGVYLSGAVQPHITECYAFRSTVGSVPASDSFYGFFLNGASGLTAAGGNASVYFTDCTAACSLTLAQLPTNVGFGLSGPSADTFILRGEVTSCQQGVVVIGAGTQAGDADIHITGLVMDGIGGNQGILVNGYLGALSITDNYVAPSSAATSFYALAILNSNGVVTSNNQWVCWPSTGAGGIRIDSSNGIQIGTDIVLGAAKPVEVNASSVCRIGCTIYNPSTTCSQGAVNLTNLANRCVLAATILGGTGRFTYGYNLVGTTNASIEMNVTTIVPGALASASNKVFVNGAAVTTTGVSGTHLVTGIF